MATRMARTARLALLGGLALLALASLAPAAAGDGEASAPFLGGFLKETRIVYPLQVGEWEAVGERLYDAAELGASVRYRSGTDLDRWIDVYFYPVGVVPDSYLRQAAQASLQELDTVRDSIEQASRRIDHQLVQIERARAPLH